MLLGQSLGTAVASAVGLHFASLGTESGVLPELPTAEGQEIPKTVFSGIVLVAPFTSLPNLLQSYRIGGVVPVLAPLKQYPRVLQMFTDRIADRWPTAKRLRAYVQAVAEVEGSEAGAAEKREAAGAAGKSGAGKDLGSVTILHAQNDGDISFHQSRALFAYGTSTIEPSDSVGVTTWKEVGKPTVEVQILEFGGEFFFFLGF